MPKLSYEKRQGLRTWVEINAKVAEKNFQTLKKLLSPKTKFAAVTKSNAYGHDLVEYSRLMEKFGADLICVDSIMEAKALREAGIKKPILVLGYTLPENFKMVESLNMAITISSLENLKKVVKSAKTTHLGVQLPSGLKIHLKFDTGMSRQGFLKEDLEKIFKMIEGRPIVIEGIYTHFAKAKVPNEKGETSRQKEEFEGIISAFRKKGYKPMAHAGATSGGIVYHDAHFDMVRFGIGIYGLWPEKAVKEMFEKEFRLEPVLSWKSVVSEVKKLPKGRGVGYDLTYTLKRKSKTAVVPIGYWHGYLRALSNKSSVLIRGQRAKLLGRVSMGMIVVDVTDIKGVKPGNEVVLIGRQGREEVSADELAELADTINYEIVTRINPLSRRFYLK
ncbi:alanine racemase [Candidatus Campbellbacteria bacterium CG22_combo_CG10-13_8_21_14_all_43_18]|uniref:Alanine racemase n=1 Tax=Candidatus Campbellbacteria bacterium CG22_combo_CG10-13_8_21_14_all_43_18 TaxID=1974530 RepID=A0A2H0DXI5_9BACT|nr:MAG: alanine racemase [Candidatus Campbellbacteria bacterium CG22_combo_CG10-13_8_21_14_all_43_18]